MHHFWLIIKIEGLDLNFTEKKNWQHLSSHREYSREYFKPNSMCLGPIEWILQLFFCQKLVFWSNIVIFEAFLQPFCAFLFVKFSSMNIFDVLNSYFEEKSRKKASKLLF